MLRPRYSTAQLIDRGVVNLAHGAVHYRAAGDGPVVLALHESPRSSLSLLPLITLLADRYRVIAPDTPGYGFSDPLVTDVPTMDDFVGALVGFMDGLGLGRVGVYGTHTGAALASALAARHPERITALVLDGISAFTPCEISTFNSRYLPPYAPDWEGRHVMGLWSRVRDAATWFPWHERLSSRRLGFDPPDLRALEYNALGFLQAGPHYAKAYRLAAGYQPDIGLRGVAAPVTIIARPDDLLVGHLNRLDADGPWRIQRISAAPGDWRDTILAALARGATPDAAPANYRPDRIGATLVKIGGAHLWARSAGRADGDVRILLSDLPGDPATFLADQAARFPADRLIALDAPGCGASDPLANGDLESVVDALQTASAANDANPRVIVGEGAASAIAAIWAARIGARLETMAEPPWLRSPALRPDQALLDKPVARWDGAHLTAAWFQLRDLALYHVPPGQGLPQRRSPTMDLARLDRRFRALIAGPEAAELLSMVSQRLA